MDFSEAEAASGLRFSWYTPSPHRPSPARDACCLAEREGCEQALATASHDPECPCHVFAPCVAMGGNRHMSLLLLPRHHLPSENPGVGPHRLWVVVWKVCGDGADYCMSPIDWPQHAPPLTRATTVRSSKQKGAVLAVELQRGVRLQRVCVPSDVCRHVCALGGAGTYGPARGSMRRAWWCHSAVW
jgi:hypothetical protein